MSPRQDNNTMPLLNVGLIEERLAAPDLMIDDDDDDDVDSSSSCSSDDNGNDNDECSDCSGPDWDWQTLETRTLEEEGYSHKHSIIHQHRSLSLSQQRRRKKKNITFSSQTYNMVEIISRNDYTPKELKACWYTLEDKSKMNSKHEKYVARFESGKAPKSNQTYRGLECWSIQGAKDLETTITRTIDAVMDEQDRQWMAFKDDYERLAYVSIQSSEPSKKLAYEMAKLDEQAVKEQYEAEEADASGRGDLQDVSSSEVGSERLDENPIPVSPVSSASRKKKTLSKLRSSSRSSSNTPSSSSTPGGGSGSSSSSKMRKRRKSSSDKQSKSHSSKGGRKKSSTRNSSSSSSQGGGGGKADPPGTVVHHLPTTHLSPTTIVKLLPKTRTTTQSLPARTA